MYKNKIVKKLRFLKSGGSTDDIKDLGTSDFKDTAEFDTLMTGASNLFVNFNKDNINNRKVSISTPFDFISNVEGSDSFYTPMYQTDIDKEIEERLNSREDESTQEVQQESDVESNASEEVDQSKNDSESEKPVTASYKYIAHNGKKSKKVFDEAMDRVAKYDPRLTEDARKFLTEMAARESGFKINANAVTNAHTGYFQLSDNNIKAFANNATKDQYVRDPELQITSALNLIDEFTRLIPRKTLEKAIEKGYNKFGLVAGAWAGGNGGVNAFILKDEDRSDTHHYRKAGNTEAKGVSVGQYIKTFSELFKNK